MSASQKPVPEYTDTAAAGWEAAGRRIAPMLGSYSSAVVTSADELAAAYVALGIGRSESERRRVAIADLVGEVEPLQRLVASDDPHGISDSFTYGVSLNKIAQPIDATGNLFVMPSGTGSVTDPEIFRNTRWQRLANGFREVGALLLIVAPAETPGLRDLINQTDGVVLVGSSPLDLAPYLNVLARVPAPLPVPAPKPQHRKRPAPWGAALLVALLLAAGVTGLLWYGRHGPFAVHHPRARRRAAVPSPAPAPPQPAPAETLVVPPPANPADSVRAAEYAVELEAWNTLDDAALTLQRNRAQLPAAAISPVPMGQSRELYYKLIAGAFPRRGIAQHLLWKLRQAHVIQDAPGTVVRTPYALQLDSAEAGHTEALVQKYAGIGVPVYVLEQPGGSLKLYAGAFERPEDSATLLAALCAAKLNPTLVYRTGRSP